MFLLLSLFKRILTQNKSLKFNALHEGRWLLVTFSSIYPSSTFSFSSLRSLNFSQRWFVNCTSWSPTSEHLSRSPLYLGFTKSFVYLTGGHCQECAFDEGVSGDTCVSRLRETKFFLFLSVFDCLLPFSVPQRTHQRINQAPRPIETATASPVLCECLIALALERLVASLCFLPLCFLFREPNSPGQARVAIVYHQVSEILFTGC